jgi:hypothetical protein
MLRSENTNRHRNPKTSPRCAPDTSKGAKSPPGVAAAYDTAPSPQRTRNNNGISALVPAPAKVRWVIGSPPPTRPGANHASIPTAAPISAARSSTGQRISRRLDRTEDCVVVGNGRESGQSTQNKEQGVYETTRTSRGLDMEVRGVTEKQAHHW